MKRGPARQRIDHCGIALSVGCAVHCATTPALMAVVPVLGVGGWLASPLVHQIAAVLCCVLVAKSILPAWRWHRDSAVGACVLGGIALLLIAAFVIPDPCCQSPVALGWFGRSLMTIESTRQWLGVAVSHHLLRVQPFLTPIGGMLLIAAHVSNLDLVRRHHRHRCGNRLPAAGRV